MHVVGEQEIGDVIRRVGGLEVVVALAAHNAPVIRRVGGLEGEDGDGDDGEDVIRRVGGLEDLFLSV